MRIYNNSLLYLISITTASHEQLEFPVQADLKQKENRSTYTSKFAGPLVLLVANLSQAVRYAFCMQPTQRHLYNANWNSTTARHAVKSAQSVTTHCCH